LLLTPQTEGNPFAGMESQAACQGVRGRLGPGHIWGKRQPGLRKAHADKEIERHHGSKRNHLARGDRVASSLQRAIQGELGTRLPLECAEAQVLCNGSFRTCGPSLIAGISAAAGAGSRVRHAPRMVLSSELL